MEDMFLFPDLDILETEEDEDVSPRPGSRNQARIKMKKIMAGEIDVSTLEMPLDAMEHVIPGLPLDTLRSITRQLGFTPVNLVDVSFRDPRDGHPQVLRLYPMNIRDPTLQTALAREERIPFPTTYWISCPLLHARISRLEEDGWIHKFMETFRGPDAAQHLQAMERAHRLYAEERWAMLSEEDRTAVAKNGWERSLKTVGVAGIRNFSSIKCLHTHYAHFASRPEHGNVIGQWVSELLANDKDVRSGGDEDRSSETEGDGAQ